MTVFSRRKLLISAAALTAVGGALAAWRLLESNPLRKPPDALQEFLDGEEFKKTLFASMGSEYLTSTPDEATPQALVKLLTEGTEGFRSGMSAKDAAAHLHKLITDDYNNGRLILLKNWLVSPTEGRICALVTLIHQ